MDLHSKRFVLFAVIACFLCECSAEESSILTGATCSTFEVSLSKSWSANALIDGNYKSVFRSD